MNTTVKDLIIPLEQFPHVQSEAPVHEAVGLLFSHVNGTGRLQYDELLVINADNQYVGRLTVRSILTCYFPSLFATGDKQIFAGKQAKFTDLAILMENSFQGECKRQGALPVRDYMAPPLKSIKANLHPLHAAEIMMAENETCLPVVEDDGLIGLVRLIDLFRTLASSCSL
ncbi:MAG: CBS domain-containing protein [Desulfobulbus sp.]|nr:CBS domain-containing protein [Desulfobulbus sp.]